MASEGFLWLSNLGVPDSAGVLPLMGAIIALTNAETLGRKREQAMEAVAARKSAAKQKQSPPRKPPALPRKPKVVEAPASPARYESPPSAARAQIRQLSTTAPVHAVHRPIIRNAARSTSRRTLDEIPAAEGAPDGTLTEADKANVRSTFLTYVLRGMAVMFIPFASTVPAVSSHVRVKIQLIFGRSPCTGSRPSATPSRRLWS